MISIVILTFNSDKTLDETLQSVKDFKEVLIVDSGSTDQTLHLASKYPNTRTLKNFPFPGFGLQRQFAEKAAKYDWILALDSDEVLSEELKKEIGTLGMDPKTIYALPRNNFFGSKRIYHTSWSPDYCLRLYHRKNTGFDDALVHENIKIGPCKIHKLKAAMRHTSYFTISDFLIKMEKYSSYFVLQNKGKKTSSLKKAISRGIWAFLKNYFIKLGILDGREGIIISLYNAHCTYYKYLNLSQMNKDSTMTT
jgi:glycosyltransferase involved in cell wall biosynthesis